MASIFKPKGSKKYVIVYQDEDGRRRKKTGTTDKGVTERIARDLENRAALRREGVIDPKEEAYAREAARPVSEHLEDFRAHLIGKGNTKMHADLTRNRVAKVVALIRGASLAAIDVPPAAREARRKAEQEIGRRLAAARISDLTGDRVQAVLAIIRAEGRSLETLNHHLRAVKGFSRWMWRVARRTRDDALAGLPLFNSATDRRRERRALSAEEAAAIVRSAEAGPIVMGMSGPDRAMLYRVALGTGLRAEELRCLTVESFQLAPPRPVVVCLAAYTKNGERAEQPISEGLARLLGPFLAPIEPGGCVFEAMPALKTAAMLRADLEAAGIPYRDDAGRVADFHSLRATYITEIVRGGASVKTAQSLARHASPVLTIGRYAKASVVDQAAAVEGLPDLTGSTAPGRETVSLAASGTEGLPRATAGATGPVRAASGGNEKTRHKGESGQRVRREAPPGFEPGNNGFATRGRGQAGGRPIPRRRGDLGHASCESKDRQTPPLFATIGRVSG